MNGLASQIDGFLGKRASPLAGYGKTFVAAGRKYGVDPRLVVAISGIESSFGKHIFGSHNAWGWGPGKPFGSWDEAITTVTKGLRSGYLDRGLRTPEQIVHRYAPGSDGNDTDNWVRVVNQFLGELGASPKKLATKAMAPVPTTAPTNALPMAPFNPGSLVRSSALANLGDISRTGKLDPNTLLSRTAQLGQDIVAARQEYELANQNVASIATPGPAVYRDPGGKGGARPKYVGKILQPGSRWVGTHVTDNLDWNNGRRTALDILAAPGTPVGAPLDGVITEHGSAQGGRSLYFTATNGARFWLGHIENPLPVGTRVRRGQPIAVISGNHETPHLHIDRKL